MRSARLLLLCLVPIAGCSAEETDHGPHPPPAPRSFFATCEGQPELGDTWERQLNTQDVQLDGEGNVYLFGNGPIDLACGDPNSRPFLGGWSYVAKLGPRGDARWLRAWEQDAYGVVTPSGETLVMVETPGMQVLDPDGAIRIEQTRRSGWPVLAPTANGFLLSGHFFRGDDVGLEDVDFETASDMAFVSVVLDRDLTPRQVAEAPVIVGAEPKSHAAMTMNNGDVLTAHIEPVTFDPRFVLTRRSSQPWQQVIPLGDIATGSLRLWDLGDDTFIVQTGTALWRFADSGDLLWIRQYGDALSIEEGSRSPGRRMAVAADPTHLIIGYAVNEEDGPIETSDGNLTPLGRDIAFSFVDIDSGVPSTVRLMQREGDDAIGSIALDRDGAMVVTTTHELPNQLGSSFVEKLRIEP